VAPEPEVDDGSRFEKRFIPEEYLKWVKDSGESIGDGIKAGVASVKGAADWVIKGFEALGQGVGNAIKNTVDGISNFIKSNLEKIGWYKPPPPPAPPSENPAPPNVEERPTTGKSGRDRSDIGPPTPPSSGEGGPENIGNEFNDGTTPKRTTTVKPR